MAFVVCPSPTLPPPRCRSAAQLWQKASDFAGASDPSGGYPAPPSCGGMGEGSNSGGGSRCERGFIRGIPPGAGTSRFLETTMAIGLAALGLLAFLLGCSGTFAQPQNSERAAKVRCGVAGRGSQPPLENLPPPTSLSSGGRQEQLVGAGELHRECRFLVVDRTWCRRAERQRPWVPDRQTPRVSASVLGRDVCSLPPGLVLSLAAQMAERSAGGSRPGRGLAVASPDGLWDAAPLPAPPGVGNLGGRARRWVNEKGSKIVISHDNNAGVFRGFYLTALTATNNTIRPSPLQGIQHLEPQPTFGFILKWNFSASTTVFVGQCFQDENGEDQLNSLAAACRGGIHGRGLEGSQGREVGAALFRISLPGSCQPIQLLPGPLESLGSSRTDKFPQMRCPQ
ncbi:avidin-like [Crotalus adamanteus]|uniref:Avidin-like n=1 Tax=Crotalus adamanteus TaxID=8729 RepID=A0AAW1C4P6_CROAD